MPNLENIINWKSPSEVLLVAYLDLKAISQNPDYKINMSLFHTHTNYYDSVNYCHVCLAGSVMAGTLHKPKTEDAAPSDFKQREIQAALIALDQFRRGQPDWFEQTILRQRQTTMYPAKLAFDPFYGRPTKPELQSLFSQLENFSEYFSRKYPIPTKLIESMSEKQWDLVKNLDLKIGA